MCLGFLAAFQAVIVGRRCSGACESGHVYAYCDTLHESVASDEGHDRSDRQAKEPAGPFTYYSLFCFSIRAMETGRMIPDSLGTAQKRNLQWTKSTNVPPHSPSNLCPLPLLPPDCSPTICLYERSE